MRGRLLCPKITSALKAAFLPDGPLTAIKTTDQIKNMVLWNNRRKTTHEAPPTS